MTTRTRTTTCPHDCPSACGLQVTLDGDRVVAVRGDPDHPVTQGAICPKTACYAEHVHHPNRVRHALRRVGAKGEGRFARVPLDEALDEVAERLRSVIAASGPEAVLPFSYAGSMGFLSREAGHAFFHHMGASQLERTICSGATSAAWKAAVGKSPGSSPERVLDSDLVVVWGTNLASTHLHFLRDAQRARKRGARLVVIDAYRNRTARVADDFLAVRPGTDAWLALGMLHVLARDGFVDEPFVARWVDGWPELRDEILPDWTPEKAATTTGVPAARIEDLARRYGQARAPFLRVGHGMARHLRGGAAIRAIAAIPALCGVFARAQGGMLLSSRAASLDLPFYTREDLLPDPPPRTVNMNQLGQALTEPGSLGGPPIEALFVYQSNPAEILPDQGTVWAGLAREDLFTVVHEIRPTRTADFADIVLPAPTSFEVSDLYGAYGHSYLRWSEAIVPAQGDAIGNRTLFAALARRMGYDDPVFGWTDPALAERMLADGAGFDPTKVARAMGGEPVALRPPGSGPFDPERGFGTPDGRFRLRLDADAAEGPELSATLAPPPPPVAPADRPLRFLSVPGHYTLNSSFGDLPTLRRRQGPPVVLVHPNDAARYGVDDGRLAELDSAQGTLQRPVRVTDDVPPGVVVAEGMAWARDCPDGRGVNTLAPALLTDLGRGGALNETWVRLRPAGLDAG